MATRDSSFGRRIIAWLCVGIGALGMHAEVRLNLLSKDTLTTFVTVVFGLSVLLSAAVATQTIRQRLATRQGLLKLTDLEMILEAVVGTLVATAIVVGWTLLVWAAFHLLINWLFDPSSSKTAATWVVLPAVGLIGVLLFFVRLRLRFAYGISEALAGLMVAWTQVQQAIPGQVVISRPFLVALLTASVYLIVRGLDNAHVGWTAKDPDPSLRFVRKLFKLNIKA